MAQYGAQKLICNIGEVINGMRHRYTIKYP